MYDHSFRIDIIERYVLLECGEIIPYDEVHPCDEVVLIGTQADIRDYLREVVHANKYPLPG